MINEALNAYSAILDESGKRINYKDYLLSCKNKDLNEAVKRIIVRIDLDKINKIIDIHIRKRYSKKYSKNRKVKFWGMVKNK